MATDWVWRMLKWIGWKVMGPQRKTPNLGGAGEPRRAFRRSIYKD